MFAPFISRQRGLHCASALLLPASEQLLSSAGTCSSALFGYALEALVDVWSSVLVLYRFWNDPDGEGAYFEITRRRETRASVGIAFTFVLASIAIAIQVRASLRSVSQHVAPPAASALVCYVDNVAAPFVFDNVKLRMLCSGVLPVALLWLRCSGRGL